MYGLTVLRYVSKRSYAFSALAQNARKMASVSSRASLSHVERTAQEPRDNSLYMMTLSRIEEVNNSIRLLRLSLPQEDVGIKFLPGQWLDVHIPGLPKPGGFTITSTPNLALRNSSSSSIPYIELAIQKSTNPPAAWLWRPIPSILNSTLQIRVGGSFVWPHPTLSPQETKNVKKVVFIAGGVGINPLVSILAHFRELKSNGLDTPGEIVFIYSVKGPEEGLEGSKILFLERVVTCMEGLGGDFRLFLTGRNGDGEGSIEVGGRTLRFEGRRVGREDVVNALGPVEDRENVVCYICGVQTMTDEFVDLVQKADGMDKRKVFCERWW